MLCFRTFSVWFSFLSRVLSENLFFPEICCGFDYRFGVFVLVSNFDCVRKLEFILFNVLLRRSRYNRIYASLQAY